MVRSTVDLAVRSTMRSDVDYVVRMAADLVVRSDVIVSLPFL